MAEKKKPKLEALLEAFQKNGGDAESLSTKAGTDAKFYESHILPTARDLASPQTRGLIAGATHKIREDLKSVLTGYLNGEYKKGLTEKLKEGEELPEGHTLSFAHLGDAGVAKAREMLNEAIFHGMGYRWGLPVKDIRDKYRKGDAQIREQFSLFLARYVGGGRDAEGRELSPERVLNDLATKLAKAEHLPTAMDAADSELNQFLSGYATNINRFSPIIEAYTKAAQGHARTHKGVVKKAANKIAGGYKDAAAPGGYQLTPDAEAGEMVGMYVAAHGKDFPFKDVFKKVIEPVKKQ